MTEYTTKDSATLFWGEHDDFDPEPVAAYDNGSGRWHDYITKIYRRTADGTFWGVDASLGKTEMQEHEYNDPPYQVEAREETIPARVVTLYYREGKRVGTDDSSDWEASEFEAD